MEEDAVFDALYYAARSATAPLVTYDHWAAFYGALSVANVALTLYGINSPEYDLIRSYVSLNCPSLFVGPLPLEVSP